MAHDWDELPNGWSNNEADFFWSLSDELNPDDEVLQGYFHLLYVEGGGDADMRATWEQNLAIYAYDTYGLDWFDVWDWEAYREAYGEF